MTTQEAIAAILARLAEIRAEMRELERERAQLADELWDLEHEQEQEQAS